MRLDTHATGNESEFIHGIVFAELVSYIEENIADKSIAPIFKLAHLVKLYGDRLTQLGLDMSVQRVHSTRLKVRLLIQFPEMRGRQEGRDVLLMFASDICPALQ